MTEFVQANAFSDITSGHLDKFGKSDGQLPEVWRYWVREIESRCDQQQVTPQRYKQIIDEAWDILFELHLAIRGKRFDSPDLERPNGLWYKRELPPGYKHCHLDAQWEEVYFSGKLRSAAIQKNCYILSNVTCDSLSA